MSRSTQWNNTGYKMAWSTDLKLKGTLYIKGIFLSTSPRGFLKKGINYNQQTYSEKTKSKAITIFQSFPIASFDLIRFISCLTF